MPSTSPITTRLVNNMMEVCSAVQKAMKEYSELPPTEQHQVWDDLTGDEARRRLFGHDGRELWSFAQQHEPLRLVQDSLQQLQLELQLLSGEPKVAIDKAMQQSPTYLQDASFCLKFLRAEKFDVKAAALRMGRHFEEKSRLFPDSLLTKEIQLSDLSEDDMACLKSGYLQILPELDCANRKVVFYYKAVSDCYKQRENLLRAFWFVMNYIAREEDVQKLGVVNVVYNIGGFPKHGMDYEKSRRLSKLFRAIPVRFNSFYPCVDEMAWIVVVETFAVMISRFLRIRLRVITGNHDQVCFKLKSVGIPADAMPVNEQSELRVDQHLAWMEHLEKLEEEAQAVPELTGETPERPRQTTDAADLYKPEDITALIKATSSFYAAVG